MSTAAAVTDLSDLNAFLQRNAISQDDWEKSGCDWAQLCAIRADHEANTKSLESVAELFAGSIQRFPRVHSVRWRIKDPQRLLKKIIRKRVDGVEKYKNVDVSNYFDVVDDLVGIRALHLFKDDCFAIDEQLKATTNIVDPPIAYIRRGDQDSVIDRMKEFGFDLQEHRAGYRSVHYVIWSQTGRRKVKKEVQVRTIFEEGWSEIDHQVRYPDDLSRDVLVNYLLTIFNRMAGNADEMGGYVRGLATYLEDVNKKHAELRKENEAVWSKMTDMIEVLEASKQQSAESQKQIAALKSELNGIREREELARTLSAIRMPDLPKGGLLGLDSSGWDKYVRLGNLPSTGATFGAPLRLYDPTTREGEPDDSKDGKK